MKRVRSFIYISIAMTMAVSFGSSAMSGDMISSQVSYGPGMVGPLNGNMEEVKTLQVPQIQAEGVALINAETGEVLYEKNGNMLFYPASITKLMTALLVVEQKSLDDVVTFSKTATTNLESGSVGIDLVEGDTLTVRDSLYALLLKSANEVANGLAELVGGSKEGFAAMMNEKAKALGCTNTNFVNPSGLNDKSHSTTPTDMAKIAKAALENQTVAQIASTPSYQLPASKKRGPITVTMGHKMIQPGHGNYDARVLGGKTGYTSLAGNTLVTKAKSQEASVIAVIMKSKSTHYSDTKALLDYGLERLGTTSRADWQIQDNRWYLKRANGTYPKNQWVKVDGVEYWFDSDGYMAIGWRKIANQWYYFRSSGAMAKNYWAQDNGGWYYLGEDGIMVKNRMTPDGFEVDGTGRWKN